MRVKLKDYTQTKIISYNTKKKNNLDKKNTNASTNTTNLKLTMFNLMS